MKSKTHKDCRIQFSIQSSNFTPEELLEKGNYDEVGEGAKKILKYTAPLEKTEEKEEFLVELIEFDEKPDSIKDIEKAFAKKKLSLLSTIDALEFGKKYNSIDSLLGREGNAAVQFPAHYDSTPFLCINYTKHTKTLGVGGFGSKILTRWYFVGKRKVQ